MPRKLIRRWMPDSELIRRHKHLRCLGTLLERAHLWRLNRHAVALAFMVGLFAAFIPVPFQMLIAAVLAIAVQANLPIAVALVWVTNPLTMPLLFFGAYKIGAWMLGLPPQDFDFHLSMHWLLHGLAATWKPFLLGCLVSGFTLAVTGYFGMQLLWRAYVVHHRRRRRLARLDRAS